MIMSLVFVPKLPTAVLLCRCGLMLVTNIHPLERWPVQASLEVPVSVPRTMKLGENGRAQCTAGR